MNHEAIILSEVNSFRIVSGIMPLENLNFLSEEEKKDPDRVEEWVDYLCGAAFEVMRTTNPNGYQILLENVKKNPYKSILGIYRAQWRKLKSVTGIYLR